MDPVALPNPPAPELAVAQQRPVDNEANIAREAAERRLQAHMAAQRNELLPDKLLVRLDAEAQRFVQIVSDPDTSETIRKYPSEAQLAYSRAVMAYLRALDR